MADSYRSSFRFLHTKAMDDIVKNGYLYDFYGELLNEHQQSIMEDYFYNDLSLSEIAQNHEISRQGVHDIIKRCTKYPV